MPQTSVILQQLLTSLTSARQGTTLVLDQATLGTTSAAALLDLFSEQLQITSFTLQNASLPASVTATSFAVSGNGTGVTLDLTFEEALGEVAIEALFRAPAIAPLQQEFPSLPSDFFNAITVSGATAGVSVPGLVRPLTLTAPRYGVVGLVMPSSGLVTTSIAPRVDGQASAATGGPKGLAVEVQTATSGYRLAPLEDEWTFSDLGWLAPGLGLLAAFPDVIPTGNLGLRGFDLNLYTYAAALSSISLDVADATDPASPLWRTADGKVELTDVIVTLDLTYPSQDTLALAGTGYLQGNFTLGTIALNVQIPFPPTGIWSLTAYPNLPLPTLDDIASLVEGGSSKLGEVLPAQLGGIGGFEFSYLRVAVDASALSLAEFTFALTSTAPWPLIPGVIELSSLRMSLTIDGTPAVTGTVTGTVQLPQGDSILVSLGCGTPQGPWRLNVVSPAIALPDLGQLARLAQGQDLAAMIKAGGLDQLHFVMTDLNFGVTISPAKLTNLGLTLQLADVLDPLTPVLDWNLIPDWEIIPGVLTLTQFSFGFQIDWGDTVTKHVSGAFVLNGLEFDVTFASQTAGATVNGLIGDYSAQGASGTINIKNLIHGIAPGVAADIPDNLEIDLADAVLAYLNTGDTPATGKFLFAMDIAVEFPICNLPLVAMALPAGATAGVGNLKVVVASAALSANDVDVINDMAGKTVLTAPAANASGDVLPAGPSFTADLQVGTDHMSISLGVPASAAPPATRAAALADTPSQGAGQWFTVQRTIGVLTINRIGVLYQQDALLFGLDAAIALGPLGLSLQGLAFGSPLSAFHPVFSLDGLGLNYADGPLEITGALLRTPDSALPPGVTLQFDGSALVKAETFGLAAVGSWAQLASGQPSLFVFAEYDEPLGGPPALFVTGLMAGFGYNRSLALPAQNEVAGFPLLLLNQASAGGQASGADAVLAILEGERPATSGGTARQWIAPAPGSDWLAVGVVFTSFELVQSRALLVAQFGAELSFALLGTSTLQLPVPGEPGPTYAYAELDLEAVLKPDEGFFGLTAVLAPASYVLTQACHLTGGFAMSVWFGDNPNAGQFVLTLGGYHPAFSPPPYYPSVPRLGFNWAVSDTVTVSGYAYLAVTPSCAMASAGLDVEFHDGDLRAWFTAQADMLMSWRPFFFTADIEVSIGVSYRLNLLFCSKTISISLGAGLTLWGPPTGGRVHVELWIISFTVAFGAGPPGAADKPLGWSEFSALLPAPSSAVTVAATGGLMATMDSTVSSSGKAWLVRARDFSFATQSALPASHLRYGDTPTTGPFDQHNFNGAAVDVRPMNLTGVVGVHRLTLYRGSEAAPATGWTMSPRAGNLPESLWGTPPSPFTQIPAAPSAAVIPGQYVGYDVAAAPPAAGATRGVFPIAELAQTQLPPGGLPLVPAPPPDPDYTPAADTTSVGLIAGVAAAAPARTAVYQALSGIFTGTDGPLTQLAARAQQLFTDAPMVEGVAP